MHAQTRSEKILLNGARIKIVKKAILLFITILWSITGSQPLTHAK